MGPKKTAKTAVAVKEKKIKPVAGAGIAKAAKPKRKPRGRPKKPQESSTSNNDNDNALSPATIAMFKKQVAAIRRAKKSAEKAAAKETERASKNAPTQAQAQVESSKSVPPGARMATRGRKSNKSTTKTAASIERQRVNINDQIDALTVNETRINPRFNHLAEKSVFPPIVAGIGKKEKKSREIKEAIRRSVKIEPPDVPDMETNIGPLILETSLNIKPDPDSAYSSPSPHEISSPPNSPLAKRIKHEVPYPKEVSNFQENITFKIREPIDSRRSTTSKYSNEVPSTSTAVENVLSIGEFAPCTIVSVVGNQPFQKQEQTTAGVSDPNITWSTNRFPNSPNGNQQQSSSDFSEVPLPQTSGTSLGPQSSSTFYFDHNEDNNSVFNLSDIPLPEDKYVPSPRSQPYGTYKGQSLYPVTSTPLSPSLNSYAQPQPRFYGYGDYNQQYPPPYYQPPSLGQNFYQSYPQFQHSGSQYRFLIPPLMPDQGRSIFPSVSQMRAQVPNQSYVTPKYGNPQTHATYHVGSPRPTFQHYHKFPTQLQEKPWMAYRPQYLKRGLKKPKPKKKTGKRKTNGNANQNGNGNGNKNGKGNQNQNGNQNVNGNKNGKGNQNQNGNQNVNGNLSGKGNGNNSISFIDCPSCHQSFYDKTTVRKHFEECVKTQKP